MEKKNKARAETGIYLIVVTAILIVANVISVKAYQRFDTTRNQRFTLSKGSARLVHDLGKDLNVTLYVTRGLAKHEVFIQDLTDLMNEYERAGGEHFHYTFVEPKTEEEKEKAKKDGMQEATFGEGSETGKDQAILSKGFMGISFKYGTEQDSIPIMSPDQSQGLEFWITNKIREVRDRADGHTQKIGVLTGKDEIKLSESNLIAAQGRGQGPNIKDIIERAFPFYKFEDVDLQGGDAEINKELVGIIVTQPGKDYTEKELRRIDQFLMLGDKSLTVVAGAVNLKASDPSMKAELNLHGLDKLLDGYGIEIKKDAVLDWGRSLTFPVQTASGQFAYIRAPGIVQAQIDSRFEDKEQLLDTSFAPFFRLDELAFPFPSTLIPHPDKQPKTRMHVVARTTPKTTADASDSLSVKYSTDWRPKGEFGQRVMAVAIEPACCDGAASCGAGDACKSGVLKSAFDAGESKGGSRILVISAPQFFANPFARSGNAPPMPPQMMMMGQMGGDEELMMISGPYAQKYLTPTILAFKNTLDWMAGDSDLIASSAKLLSDSNLTYSDISRPKQEATDDDAAITKKAEDYKAERKRVQQSVTWTLTLVPALLFALLGVLRWRMRESQRANLTID